MWKGTPEKRSRSVDDMDQDSERHNYFVNHMIGSECETLPQIRTIIEELNAVTGSTGERFFLLPLVEGGDLPEVGDQESDAAGYRIELVARSAKPGSITSSILASCPTSIREGSDHSYKLLQLRLNEVGSIEAQMNTTTFLGAFVYVSATSMCYFLQHPDHEVTPQNWRSIIHRHKTVNRS